MNIFSKALGFAVLVAVPFVAASQTGEDSEVMPAGQKVEALTNDVSSNGSFSYAVPFDLPAYRGLVPGVSLSYNSSNKAFGYERNLSGIGWSLTGFSMIEWQTPGGGTPIYGSSQSDSINIFTLDGEPLLACADATASNPWTADYPADYKTSAPSASCTAGGNFVSLNEDHRKILRTANGWEITNPNGTKYIYDNLQTLGAAATEPTFTSKARFLLTSITDVNGNTVDIAYYIDGFADGYVTRPATIIYGGDVNAQGYKVQFMYGDRGYDITYALGWEKLGRHSKLLEAVTVNLNGQHVRAYDMTYELSAETARHRLVSVTEYGDDFVYHAAGNVTGSALPATSFLYSEEKLTFSQQWGPERVHSYLTVADFDNDGIDEIYSPAVRQEWRQTGSVQYTLPESMIKFDVNKARTGTTPGIPVFIRQDANTSLGWRHGFGPTTTPEAGVNSALQVVVRRNVRDWSFQLLGPSKVAWDYEFYDFGPHFADPNVPASLVNTTTWQMVHSQFTPGAIDRDAPMEMFLAQNYLNSEKIYTLDSNGFTYLYDAEGRIGGRRLEGLSDINGDGASDIRRVWDDDGTKRRDIRFGLGHDGAYVTTPFPSGGRSGPHPSDEWFGVEAQGPEVFGDVNGDGIPDRIVVDRVDQKIHVYLGSGDGRHRAPPNGAEWAIIAPNLKDSNMGDARTSITDVNGDGLGDIVIHNGFSTASNAWDVAPDALNAYVFMSTGTSFVPVTEPNSTNMVTISHYVGAGDFNGDGVRDLITEWPGGSTVHFGDATNSSRAKTPNLLTRVITPQGEKIKVFYGSTTVNADHSAVVVSANQNWGSTPPEQQAQLPQASSPRFSGVQQVVSKIIRDNGRWQTRTYEFSYGQPYWVPDLRRFSGYQWVETLLPHNAGPNEVLMRTTFDTSAAGIGKVLIVERIEEEPNGNRTVLTRETTHWADASNTNPTVIQLPYNPQRVSTTSEVNVDGNGAFLTSSTDYTTNLYG